MSNGKTNDPRPVRGPKLQAGRRLGLAALLLVVLALLVAACGSAPEPTAAPVAAATAQPEPTSAPEPTAPPEPTSPPAPTDAPAPTGAPAPTDAPEPTAAPAAGEEGAVTPSVTVAGQEILEDQVTIAEVVSDGPGWLVIHAQAGGKPGPILGYSPVAGGANAAVTVAIDASAATGTLYAMLHTDAGQIGVWEFPDGPDAPVMVGEQVVAPAFQASMPAAASPATPTAAIEIPAGAVVVEGDEAEVEMEDFQFKPAVLVIRPGTTVKFANKDEAQHTATSDTGLFDSGYLSKGQEYSYTFTEPGTVPYYCIPHGAPGGQGMAATIIVQP